MRTLNAHIIITQIDAEPHKNGQKQRIEETKRSALGTPKIVLLFNS